MGQGQMRASEEKRLNLWRIKQVKEKSLEARVRIELLTPL